MMVTIKCHECDKELNISNDSIKGEIVTCPDCGSDFEIVGIENDKVYYLQKRLKMYWNTNIFLKTVFFLIFILPDRSEIASDRFSAIRR